MKDQQQSPAAVDFRLAQRADVPAILALLPDLSPDPDEVRSRLAPVAQAYETFDQMQRHGNVHIALAVLPDSGEAVGTCMVVIVPNFTYGRPWAMIESVVVAAPYQSRGIGAALMEFAFAFARRANCYKAQLISGPDAAQIRFYRRVGMDDSHCHGFKRWFVTP